MKWKQFIDEFGGGLKKYQKAGEIKNEDASYINFVRSLPSNLQQPNDPSYNLKGYWNALGKPESFDYNQPTDLQGYYHAFSRDPYTGQILKAPFHPSFKEGVSDKGAYRIAGPKGDIYTQGFKYPAYEGPYALPKNVIIDNSYDFLDIPNYEGYFQIGGSLPKYQDNGEVKPTDQTQPIVYSRPYPFDPYAAKNKVVSQKDVDDYNVYIQGNQPSRNFFYETHDLTKDQSGNYMWNPKKDIDYQKAIQNTSLGQFIDIVGGISKTSTDQFGNQYNTRSTGLEMGYNPYNIWASPSTGIGFYDSEYPGNVLMQLDHLENKDTYPTIYFLNNKNYELGNPKDWNSAQNDLYGKENLSTEQKERLAADNLMKVENSPTAYEIVSTDAPIDEKYVNAFGYKNDLIRLINPNLNVSGALPVTKELLAELRGIEEGFTGTNYEDQLNKEIEIKKMLLTRAGIPITDENLKTLMHYNYTPLNIYSEINRPGYPSVYKDLKKKGGSLPEFQPGGTNKPIYTSDWSKVKNYNDSLNLYNKTRDIENPNYYEQGFPSWYTHRGTREEIERFMRRNNMDVDYTGRFPGNIQPVATGYFGEGIKYPIYKKPFQPYIYDPYKEFLGRLGDVKPMGIRPTDLGAESEMPRTVNIPTRTLNSNLPRVKHSANYFESPEIVTHRTPEEGFYIEIRTPLKKTTSKPSNSKVVYQNYKQVGGEQSTEENPKVLPLTNVSSKKADWIVDKEKHGIDEIKWYESWNPKKWGLNDYSEYSSFNSAFRNARENKEEEFVYKGKRYNTQLIPKEDSDLYWESKNFLKDYYKNQPYKKIDDAYDYDFNRNVDPYLKSKYGNTWQELYEMQKQVPTGNPEWEEIQKKMNDVWDEQETIREKKNKDYDAYYKKNVIGKQSGERIASLDKPTYFSITNQKPKDMSEDGYWNPKENKMFMLANTEPGKLNTTYIHELSHKGDDIIDVMNTVPPINLEAFNAAPYKENFTQESFNYVSDPSETEARKLSTLFYLKKNKQPWKAGKITEETFNKLYEDHYDKKLPYDISQLLMLYGAQRDDLLKYLNGDFEYNYKPKEKKKGGESNVFNWSNLDQWFKNGGESDFANNIYDDYMTGIYDGTPLEGYAKKVYDKLNIMYYTQAKQAGMTPPNYIMTNVIKKSTAPS